MLNKCTGFPTQLYSGNTFRQIAPWNYYLTPFSCANLNSQKIFPILQNWNELQQFKSVYFPALNARLHLQNSNCSWVRLRHYRVWQFPLNGQDYSSNKNKDKGGKKKVKWLMMPNTVLQLKVQWTWVQQNCYSIAD